MAKKTTTKKVVKKVAAKKAAAPAKKAAKKVAAKKAAAPTKKAAKKVAAKKAPAPKKAAPKAAAPKKVAKSKEGAETSILAQVDVGFGNQLYVRGEGAGLSWNKGVLLDNVSPYEWAFKTTKATGAIEFKFLLNDELWAEGSNLSVDPGTESVSAPVFNW